MTEAILGPTNFRLSVDEPDVSTRLPEACRSLLATLRPRYPGPPIVACIGTDRSTGDALGPLVGQFLLQAGLPEDQVLGTLEEPLHAANLRQRLAELRPAGVLRGPRRAVVAIDACLGRPESVGQISLGLGSLQPGAGVNKHLPPVGDLYIAGTVNVGGFMEYFVLQNTRLSLVMRMARTIAEGLATALA